MFRAICIRGHNGIIKGEIVRVWQDFNKNVHYQKGLKIGFNIPRDEFYEHFIEFRNYYIVEKPEIKRRFRKPKKDYLRVEFRNISDEILIQIYNCAISYVELTKQVNPDLIQTFNYSIVSTLEKLEYFYRTLPTPKFIEAVTYSEQVFKGIYKTALNLDLTAQSENYEELLKGFKGENDILATFFEQLNKNQ